MTTIQIQAEKKAIYDKACAVGGCKRSEAEAFITDEQNRRLRELMFRAIIISCLITGQGNLIFNPKTKTWGETGREYGVDALGEEKAMRIWKNQKNFMSRHAFVQRDAFTGRTEALCWS